MFLLGFDSLKMNRTFFGRGLFLVFFLVFSRYFVLAWFSFSVILTILSPLFLSKYLFLLGFHFYLTWGLLGLPRWFSGLRLHAPSAEAQVWSLVGELRSHTSVVWPPPKKACHLGTITIWMLRFSISFVIRNFYFRVFFILPCFLLWETSKRSFSSLMYLSCIHSILHPTIGFFLFLYLRHYISTFYGTAHTFLFYVTYMIT